LKDICDSHAVNKYNSPLSNESAVELSSVQPESVHQLLVTSTFDVIADVISQTMSGTRLLFVTDRQTERYTDTHRQTQTETDIQTQTDTRTV